MDRIKQTKYVRHLAWGAAIAVLSLGVQAAERATAGPQAMEETTVKSSAVAAPGVPQIHGSRSVRHIVVTYADLNLARESGVATLYNRIEAAADTVCLPHERNGNLRMQMDHRACYDNAMDRAVESVGNLELQHMHLARTGRDVPTDEQVAGR